MAELTIDPRRTALVIIDLQNAVVNRQMEPNNTQDVVKRAKAMVKAFNAAKIPVFKITVSSIPKPVAETQASSIKQENGWDELVPEMKLDGSETHLVKSGWSAFAGTGLDTKLRNLGIETLVLCGISTNIGVESTARDAFDLGYNQIFAIDAMSARSAGEHQATIELIFKRIGLVRSSDEIVAATKAKK